MNADDLFTPSSAARRRILVAGATGTIGSALVRELSARGADVVALIRKGKVLPDLAGIDWRGVDYADPRSLLHDGLRGEKFDAVISCLASRNGHPRDAWAIDDQAQRHLIAAAQQSGVRHFVLLSAICVQKPKLEFQFAKLSAEKALTESGLVYSIVRPTAYFKSLAGQIKRVASGKPFLLFGDGELTACKPISDRDLATYLADCLDDPACHNMILPISGPGRAITPRAQGEEIFRLLNRTPKFKSVPVALMDLVIGVLSLLGHIIPQLKDKAEFARIGKYYATESMLVFDPDKSRYREDLTPSTGKDHLFAYYADVIAGKVQVERGEHAVF